MVVSQVANYWDDEPCHFWAGKNYETGSKEFFEAIESERYSSQDYIHKFAQFSRWHKKDVLEVGCGIGTDALQFIRSGAYYQGIDLSSYSIDIAKKRIDLYGLSPAYDPQFTVMNAENILYEDKSFDLVYSWGVIHHSPNPEKVVDEIYRVLRPNGKFVGMIYKRFSTMGLAVYLRDIARHYNPFISLTTAFKRSLESPGTKAYNIGEAKKLFGKFSDLKISYAFTPELNGLKNTPFLSLLKYYPNSLASWLVIEGVK